MEYKTKRETFGLQNDIKDLIEIDTGQQNNNSRYCAQSSTIDLKNNTIELFIYSYKYDPELIDLSGDNLVA